MTNYCKIHVICYIVKVYCAKTNPPISTIAERVLEVADQFTYLGSTVSSNLSLDRELDKRIGRASGTMFRLNKRVWSNKLLTTNTKVRVYEACVLSTLLYSSEAWTTYVRQENKPVSINSMLAYLMVNGHFVLYF